MSDITLGMAIELVVAVLLVLTIVYCIILNSRLTRLRADEEVLRATISELITATEIAERAIMGLKATAGECEKSLGSRLVQAEAMVSDMDRQLLGGNELMRKLTAIVGAGHPARSSDAPRVEAPRQEQVAREPAVPAARALQTAAEAAAERLASYRRQSREEAA